MHSWQINEQQVWCICLYHFACLFVFVFGKISFLQIILIEAVLSAVSRNTVCHTGEGGPIEVSQQLAAKKNNLFRLRHRP